MANFEVPENPEFTEGIRKLETTDRGHANVFNMVFEPIINNVLYVKKMLTEHMMAKNPHGIKPADLGLENVENKPMGELSTEFTVAKTRANIQSKQDMKTILGMLAKWYTDLKSVAWTGKYTDLTDKPTIPSGAAASCAVANNDTTTEPGSVADARIVRQHGLEIDELNRDLAALNDSGAITGLEVREGDGVYITYQDGADAVSKKLGSTIVLLGTVTAAKTFDLSSYDGYKTFALGTNILGYVSGSYNADTGLLTVNTSSVSGSVTVSGYGWVEDSGHHRTGYGEMSGTASLNYPKQVFLVY